jgi:hypothetical protein
MRDLALLTTATAAATTAAAAARVEAKQKMMGREPDVVVM